MTRGRPDHQEKPAGNGRPSRRAAVLVTALVIATAGAAAAYWSTTGRSTGTAGTATPAAVVVTAGTPVGTLVPGGSTDLALVITNPNDVEVTIPSLVLDTAQGDGGFVVDADHDGCSPRSFALTPLAGGWTVPAGAGRTSEPLQVTVEDALAMSIDAADACQGASTTVYVRAAS